jgi:hypothetical protein
MRIIILILSFYILSICTTSPLFSQKVCESTQAGGKWNNPTTWIQGTVPTKDDSVIINGYVVADTFFECKSLEIEKTGELKIIRENKLSDNIYGDLILYGKLSIMDYTTLLVHDCFLNCNKAGHGLSNLGTLVIGGNDNANCDKLKCK